MNKDNLEKQNNPSEGDNGNKGQEHHPDYNPHFGQGVDDHRLPGDPSAVKSENDSLDIESRWQDIESDYRKKHPGITDEDVNFRTGEFDNMTDRIAKRTNRSREDVDEEIRNWQNS